jgi:integrase
MATVPLFRDYAGSWENLSLPMKKRATAVTMRSHLRYLTRSDVLGDQPVSDMTWKVIQGVFTTASREMAPKTLRNYWSTLHLVLQQAMRDGHLVAVPSPDLPRNSRKPQPFYTLAHMQAILSGAKGADLAFAWVLAETGARIGETLGLKIGDLDSQRRSLRIERDIYRGSEDTLKTDSSERVISVSPQFVRKMEPVFKGRAKEAFIFATRTGSPWWPTPAQEALTRVMEMQNVPSYGFHAWRRGNITHSSKTLEMPESILAARVGHVPPSMTLGVYCQNLENVDREWAQKIGDSLSIP